MTIFPFSAFCRLRMFLLVGLLSLFGCSDTDVDRPIPFTGPWLVVDTGYEVTSSEQILSVVLQADTVYTLDVVDGSEWLVPSYIPGPVSGASGPEQRFVVSSNRMPEARTALVAFVSPDGSTRDEVTVVQSGCADPDPERTALRAIYDAASGSGWICGDNWCSDRPLGEWYGVTTDSEGHVTELRLSANNLRGALAREISDLTHLRVLDLSRNELESDLVYELPIEYTETLRSDFDALKALEDLDLSHNRFYSSSSHLPSFAGMHSLRRVDLSFNDLECRVTSPSWRPLFENGHCVDLIFHNNRMFGEVEDFIQNHPEWGRLGLQMLRQRNRNDAIDYDCPIVLPDFTFTDLRTGAQGRMRDVYSANRLTMLLSWDPTDEGSCRFAERSVYSYHALYGGQGFAVVAMIPEGEAYRRAAEAYLATHEVGWPVVADYADSKGRRIVFPREPYPSYLLFDGEGRFLEEIYKGIPCVGNIYLDEPKEFDLVERQFQYANYMNRLCWETFGNCAYESRDYSMNKRSEVLQRATRGKGIDLILMGDAFTDVDIETGFYKEVMELAMKSIFEPEPMKSYRDYFTVHMIYAVSKKRQLSDDYKDCALGTTAISMEQIEMRTFNPWLYAFDLETTTRDRFITVILNGSDAGLSYLRSEYPIHSYAYSGFSIGGGFNFPGRVQHESVGHGFGWLDDEYVDEENPDMIPESTKERLRKDQEEGMFLNLSVTNDPASVPWAHLIGHPRYPKVGIYEGGHYYNRGIWRSEPGGIMRISKAGYFTAFCRELIVRRIMELAGEEYTFEKFLANDVPPATQTTLRAPYDVQDYRHMPPIVEKAGGPDR